jgi:hypothetical protein
LHVTTKNKKVPFDKFAGQFYCFKVLSLKSSMYCQCSKFPVVRSSLTTKNDYGRPEFVTKLSEWRPEIFFYPDAEIYSFQVLWVDFPKLPLKMAINISLQINDHRGISNTDSTCYFLEKVLWSNKIDLQICQRELFCFWLWHAKSVGLVSGTIFFNFFCFQSWIFYFS